MRNANIAVRATVRVVSLCLVPVPMAPFVSRLGRPTLWTARVAARRKARARNRGGAPCRGGWVGGDCRVQARIASLVVSRLQSDVGAAPHLADQPQLRRRERLGSEIRPQVVELMVLTEIRCVPEEVRAVLLRTVTRLRMPDTFFQVHHATAEGAAGFLSDEDVLRRVPHVDPACVVDAS